MHDTEPRGRSRDSSEGCGLTRPSTGSANAPPVRASDVARRWSTIDEGLRSHSGRRRRHHQGGEIPAGTGVVPSDRVRCGGQDPPVVGRAHRGSRLRRSSRGLNRGGEKSIRGLDRFARGPADFSRGRGRSSRGRTRLSRGVSSLSRGRTHLSRGVVLAQPVPAGWVASPAVRTISPAGGPASPTGRVTSPAGGTVSPAGWTASPAGRVTSTAVRVASTAGGPTSPTGQNTSPAGWAAPPAGGITPLTSGTVSPAGRAVSPAAVLSAVEVLALRFARVARPAYRRLARVARNERQRIATGSPPQARRKSGNTTRRGLLEEPLRESRLTWIVPTRRRIRMFVSRAITAARPP
jgi:hypothetical protein